MKIRVQYCGFHFFNYEIPSNCELCKKNNFGIAFHVFFRRRRTAGKWLYPKGIASAMGMVGCWPRTTIHQFKFLRCPWESDHHSKFKMSNILEKLTLTKNHTPREQQHSPRSMSTAGQANSDGVFASNAQWFRCRAAGYKKMIPRKLIMQNLVCMCAIEFWWFGQTATTSHTVSTCQGLWKTKKTSLYYFIQ